MITSAPFHGCYSVVAAGGVTPLDPDDVANLELWLKADAIVGLSDGDPMTSWADSSGNGRNATATNSPTYQTNEINGLPAVQFAAASQQRFTLPNFMNGVFTAGTCFIVLKAAADPGVSLATSGFYGFGTTGTSSRYPDTSGNIQDVFGHSSSIQVNPAPSLVSWRLYQIEAGAAGRVMRLDGTQITSNATASGGTWPTTPTIGRTGTNTAFFDGLMAEIALYSRVLNSTERDGIEAGFAAKYGLLIA